MTFPEYELTHWVALSLLTALALFALARAWLKRPAPGLRFPAEHRLDGQRLGLKARLVRVPLALRTLAVLLLVGAAFRPQLTHDETAEVEGIDIVVAFDMSGSMASVDISDEALVALQNAGKEPKDRFTAAVDVMRDFVQSRRYDRVSLVVFGKDAFLQFPLTLDYGVMLRILDQLKLGDVDGSKTAIGNALAMSLARLKGSEAKTRLVILITDGEDNGSNVSPVSMAKKAAEVGVPIFPILVGAEGQSRKPTELVDPFTGHRLYQRSDDPVNPALLGQIADLTGGRFYRSTDPKALANDFHDILDRFEKSRLVDYAAAEKTELMPWLLLPALALLLLEVLLSQTVLRRFP